MEREASKQETNPSKPTQTTARSGRARRFERPVSPAATVNEITSAPVTRVRCSSNHDPPTPTPIVAASAIAELINTDRRNSTSRWRSSWQSAVAQANRACQQHYSMPVRLLPQSVPEDAATQSKAVPLLVGVNVTVQPPSVDPPEIEISAAEPMDIGPDAPSGVGNALKRFPETSRRSS